MSLKSFTCHHYIHIFSWRPICTRFQLFFYFVFFTSSSPAATLLLPPFIYYLLWGRHIQPIAISSSRFEYSQIKYWAEPILAILSEAIFIYITVFFCFCFFFSSVSIIFFAVTRFLSRPKWRLQSENIGSGALLFEFFLCYINDFC